VAEPSGITGPAAALPRLLYIGDVAVADTMAGEALLYRLLQFYPADRLAVICNVRPGMPTLPGVAYHHWGPAFPALLHSRLADEYVLWHTWRYYQVPSAIRSIAARFQADAILSISHVSAWLAAWQIARSAQVPLHLIAHDDFVYSSRIPAWSRAWVERKFGEAYRSASGRFCISDTMREIYRERFGADAAVIYPTYKGNVEPGNLSPRVSLSTASLTFAYGGSINSATDMDQVLAFARAVAARGHRLMVFTPQHALLSQRAADTSTTIDAFAPVPSDELVVRLRREADCLFLPQSMQDADRPWVATAFPSKWADYSTMGLPLLVWAPPAASSARFIGDHPGCAELVTSADPTALTPAIERLESGTPYRLSLAAALAREGKRAFSPQAGWQCFSSALLASAARPARAS
jgi:hypothetical protein